MNEKIFKLQKECEEKLNVFLLWKGSAHIFYNHNENKFKLKVKMNSYLSNEEFNFVNNMFDEFIFNVKFIELKSKLVKPFVQLIDLLTRLLNKNNKENLIFELHYKGYITNDNAASYLGVSVDDFNKRLHEVNLALKNKKSNNI